MSLQEIVVSCHFILQNTQDNDDKEKRYVRDVRLVNHKTYLKINFNHAYLTKEIEKIAFDYFKVHFPELKLEHCI